jgi:hypothetical protein
MLLNKGMRPPYPPLMCPRAPTIRDAVTWERC